MRQFFTIAIVLLEFSLGISQYDFSSIRFENLSVDDGLSQSTVRAIEQDKMGFMWFTTHNGLNRYDGKSFKVYSKVEGDSTSLSNNFVKGIDESFDGSLWVATSNGLNKLDRNSDKFIRYYNEPSNPNSVADNNINYIFEDEEGILWIGTQTKGLNSFNPHSKNFTRYAVNAEENSNNKFSEVNYIFEDSEGKIWVAYQEADIHIFNKKSKKFSIVPYGEMGAAGLAKTTWAIYEDQSGRIWIGTDRNGLKLYDPKKNKLTTFFHDPKNSKSISNNVVWSINEDDNNNLIIATDDGLNFLNLEKFEKGEVEFSVLKTNSGSSNSIASNFIVEIFKDNTGIIWLGTAEKGISRIDPNFLQFEHIYSQAGVSNTLSNNTVWGILEDENKKVWIGTSNGLNSFDRKTGQFVQYFSDPVKRGTISHNRTWCIVQEKENVYWLGTSKGLNRMTIQQNGKAIFKSFQYDAQDPNSISTNSVRVLLIDRDRNFWVGTNEGLNLFDKETETFRRFLHQPSDKKSISGNSIRSLEQDKSGNLWIGTNKGLNLFNFETETFTHLHSNINNPKGLTNEVVRSILEDRHGNLWIGTSNGLNKIYYKSSLGIAEIIHIDKYFEKDGLPNNVIYSIIEDKKGMIWVSTNKGISRHNPESGIFTNYDFRDGLQSNEFNNGSVFKNEEGELFFGGINGFNIFNPDDIIDSERIPHVVLTEFSVYNKPVVEIPGPYLNKHINTAEKVTLTRNDKMFSFKFSSLNYTQSHKNEYAYRLVNFDQDWNYVGTQDIAYYTNIPPGNYEFQVKTSNNLDVWSKEPTTVEVFVKPAFWQTNWFRYGALLLILGIAYLAYYLQVTRLVRNQEMLEQAVRDRTTKIQSQNKELEDAFNGLKAAQLQLIQAEKMASLGQLTAGVAHEINNPINFVASNVQALKLDFAELDTLLRKVNQLKDNPDKEKALQEIITLSSNLEADFLRNEMLELINGIERGAERTQNIVSSLHSFSRNRVDKFMTADVHDGLESTLTILKSKIGKGIKINKEFGDIPPIECQISKLNQVFLNIINNAIEAVDGKGQISIKTSQENGSVIIKIRDNGKGMDEPTKNKIFEPFFTTKDIGKGTGLGLSISYGIVKQHKGNITVHSHPEQGTEFEIELPIESTKNAESN